MNEDIEKYVKIMMEGKGYFTLPQLFSPNEIKEARDLIMNLSNQDRPKVTHFHGSHEDEVSLQRRVWNLINKGEIFQKMVQNPKIVEIASAFLGDEFILGSIAANRLLPGGPGQEPHIDYPYWDYYNKKSFPFALNPSFPLNMQVTILLDDFTENNGATAVLADSQKWGKYPTKDDENNFFKTCSRMTGKAGDAVVFFGMIWHCAMKNQSNQDRTGILIQYLPKFVKPMEDQKNIVDKEIIEKASPLLKQLLGFSYPYPQDLDEAEAKNTEGQYKKK